MDGVIVLDKPRGLTSARALDRVRAITGQRKSGHAGTLDPLAEGVLVICLGRATKLVELLMDQAKVYRTTAALDGTTASLDGETDIVPVAIDQPPESGAVETALAKLTGVLQQVPPAVSALKIGGRPAYRRARAGESVELAAREVQVHWNRLRSFRWPAVCFDTACGRGTYVRALVRDLGAALGVGGYVTELARLAVGPFVRGGAWTVERLREADPGTYLVALEDARRMLEGSRGRVPTAEELAEPGGGLAL